MPDETNPATRESNAQRLDPRPLARADVLLMPVFASPYNPAVLCTGEPQEGRAHRRIGGLAVPLDQ
jgi:hypothetical protein